MQRPHSPGSSKFIPWQKFDDDSIQQHSLFKSDHEFSSETNSVYNLRPKSHERYQVNSMVHEEKKGDISNEITRVSFDTLVSEEEELQRKREQYALQLSWISDEPQEDQNGFEMFHNEAQLIYPSSGSYEEYSPSIINTSNYQVSSTTDPQQFPLQASSKRPKNDERKNVCRHSFSHIAKEFLSEDYQSFFRYACRKHGVTNQKKARKYFQQNYKWKNTLSEVRQFMCIDEDDTNRNIKLAFNNFYKWYMRKPYTMHILTQKQIIKKDVYIETKNKLAYMSYTRTNTVNPLEEGI